MIFWRWNRALVFYALRLARNLCYLHIAFDSIRFDWVSPHEFFHHSKANRGREREGGRERGKHNDPKQIHSKLFPIFSTLLCTDDDDRNFSCTMFFHTQSKCCSFHWTRSSLLRIFSLQFYNQRLSSNVLSVFVCVPWGCFNVSKMGKNMLA